jgi:hypothetical protein
MEHILIGVIVIITIASAAILCGLYKENSSLRLQLKCKADENYRLEKENELMKRDLERRDIRRGPHRPIGCETSRKWTKEETNAFKEGGIEAVQKVRQQMGLPPAK